MIAAIDTVAVAEQHKGEGEAVFAGRTPMAMIAEISSFLGGIIGWLVVGVIAGWLAARVMKGGGYGIVGDIIVGLIGAVIGGWVFQHVVTGDAGLWGSIIVAFVGACILIAISRFLGFGHRGS